MKRLAFSSMAALALVGVAACSRPADVASYNLSQAADNFEINRRVIFYNGITDTYMLTIEGLCSLDPGASYITVTCKIGPNAFKKHFLGLSDNVTYFAEQIEPADAGTYHYRVVFNPSVIIPDVQVH